MTISIKTLHVVTNRVILQSPPFCENDVTKLSQAVLRHQSSDSGFGGGDEEPHRSSPTSPRCSRSYANKYFSSHLQDLSLYVDNREGSTSDGKPKSLSHQTQMEENFVDNITRGRSEFQLPHKLRLKRSSTKSDEAPDLQSAPEDLEPHAAALTPGASVGFRQDACSSRAQLRKAQQSSDLTPTFECGSACSPAASTKSNTDSNNHTSSTSSKKRKLGENVKQLI